MKEKSEAGSIFQKFNSLIQNQFQTNIQILRTDNGSEYFTSVLGNYLAEKGIVHQNSCVDTPQQNGRAERKNRHLLEVARALFFTTHLPNYFWGDVVLTAAYLINRMPSRVLQFRNPIHMLLDTHPHNRLISSLPLKIFGCSAFVHVSSHLRSKLDPKAIKCVFLGYSPTKKGYKCYSPSKKKFYYTMDVTFLENQPFYSKTHIQGGKSITSKDSEYQFWKLESTPTPLIQAIQVSQPIQNAGSKPVRECVSEIAPPLDCDSEPNEPIQIS